MLQEKEEAQPQEIGGQFELQTIPRFPKFGGQIPKIVAWITFHETSHCEPKRK